jgi:hypothetical protein
VVDGKNKNGWTALHLASENHHLEIVCLLLENGAVVKGKDKDGNTALHFPSQEGHLETVHLLLEKGAELDGKDNDGWTALHRASLYGHMETVCLFLLKNGAAVDGKDHKDEYTALYLASQFGTTLALIALILRENPTCFARSLSTSPVTMMVIDFNRFSARKVDRPNPPNTDDAVSTATPKAGTTPTDIDEEMKEIVLSFEFQPKNAIAVVHTHLLSKIKEAFDNDVVIYDNKGKEIKNIHPINWNPVIHQSHFHIHASQGTTT